MPPLSISYLRQEFRSQPSDLATQTPLSNVDKWVETSNNMRRIGLPNGRSRNPIHLRIDCLPHPRSLVSAERIYPAFSINNWSYVSCDEQVESMYVLI